MQAVPIAVGSLESLLEDIRSNLRSMATTSTSTNSPSLRCAPIQHFLHSRRFGKRKQARTLRIYRLHAYFRMSVCFPEHASVHSTDIWLRDLFPSEFGDLEGLDWLLDHTSAFFFRFMFLCTGGIRPHRAIGFHAFFFSNQLRAFDFSCIIV